MSPVISGSRGRHESVSSEVDIKLFSTNSTEERRRLFREVEEDGDMQTEGMRSIIKM